MDNSNVLNILLSFFSLLVIANCIYLISKRINLPYTVLLVTIGLLLFPLSRIGYFNFIDDFKLTPELVFFGFLPILLFESAYNINIKNLSKNWITISSLAFFGVIISTIFIGIILWYILGLFGYNISILITLLFGAIISATDPVAIVALFKSIGAPKRLTLIFEGESLFNDGTSVALFSIIIGIILEKHIILNNILIHSILSFLIIIFGGILFGIISGFTFSKILEKINYNEEVETSFALFSAYITFILVEVINHYIGVLEISGIIATVVSSMIIGNYGRYKISPKTEAHMNESLKFFTYSANSLVFILIGITILSAEVHLKHTFLAGTITIIVIMLARLISVFLSIKFVQFLKIEKEINKNRQKLLSWGGVRGVIAIVMVLMIPGPGDTGYEFFITLEERIGWNFENNIKDTILIWTMFTIIFTTFINTTTITYLMEKMGIYKLYKYEEVEYEEFKIITNLKILKKLHKFYLDKLINKQVYSEIKERHKNDLKVSFNKLEEFLQGKKTNVDIFIKRLMFKYALGIEKSYVQKYFFNRQINEKHYKYILKDIDANINKIDKGLENNGNLDELKNGINNINYYDKYFSFLKEKYNFEDLYIIYRTKYELSKKVIKELKKLPNEELGFNKEISDFIFNYYKIQGKRYKEKMTKILLDNSKNIKILETKIINKNLLKVEAKMLKDLYDKDLISYKYYIDMIESIENDINKKIS